jgi:hypothetical protein
MRRALHPQRLFRIALGVAALSAVRLAGASENYPAILDRQLGVECPRPLSRCRICHDTAAGGEGTANQPFALALKRDYGLSGGKAGRELALALGRLPEDLDTDADGATDKEELASCMNPSGPELSEGPGFGCAGQLALGTPRTPSLGIALLSCSIAGMLVRSAAGRRRGSGRKERP